MEKNNELCINDQANCWFEYEIGTTKEVYDSGATQPSFSKLHFIKRGIVTQLLDYRIKPPREFYETEDDSEWGKAIILKIKRVQEITENHEHMRVQDTIWRADDVESLNGTKFVLKKAGHFSIHEEEDGKIYLFDMNSNKKLYGK